MNPFHALEMAVTHKPPRGYNTPIVDQDFQLPEEGCLPDQKLTLDEAVRAYTLGSAFVNFLDKQTGTLEVGKAADIIILSHNLFAIPVTDIHSVKVLAVFIDGLLVLDPKKNCLTEVVIT